MSIAALLLFIRALGLTLPLWIVAGWSAAETAIFFLVADIPISWIAVRSGVKAGLLASLVAAFASIVGVVAVWIWASRDPAGAAAMMAALPGIDWPLEARAASIFHEGPMAMLLASISGVPFKLFALEAAKSSPLPLMLLAPLLRLPRFAAVALFSGGVSAILSRWMDIKARLLTLMILWVIFYAFYWSAMAA
jgi:hypothetical protein